MITISAFPPYALVAAALMVTMAIAWAMTLPPGRSGWIDVIWSIAKGAAAAICALLPPGGGTQAGGRQGLVAALAVVWSLRLGLHIARRTEPGHDDPRYADLRREWGANFASRSFWFLQIQAIAAMLLARAVGIAAHNPAPDLGLIDALGAGLILAGIAGEALADRQLRRFARAQAGEGLVCDSGLWGVSRHPNYFCEWLVWLGFALIAIDPSGAYHLGWMALAAPLFMYVLLVHISGIPPLEAHMLRSRGAAFRDYQARVNAFWPGPAHPAGRHPTPTPGSQT